MKEAKIHEFDPVIYPRLLWVCANSTKQALVERFEINEKQTEESLEINGVTTTLVSDLETKKHGILVFCTSKKQLTISNIAHESVHVADAIFEAIQAVGEDFSVGNEPFAYLVGWAAGCMNQVRINKFK